MNATSVEALTQFGAGVDELLAPLHLAARMRLVWRLAWTVTEVHQACEQIIDEKIAALNTDQRGRRSWHAPTPDVTETGQLLRTVPCWPSETAWLAVVAVLLDTELGTRARRRYRRVAACTVLRTAQVLARFADSATGRGCSISIEETAAHADLSDDQVKNARSVLRWLGMFVDVQFGRHLTGLEIRAARAHHGGTQRAIASEIALTVPREHAALIPTRPHSTRPPRRTRSSSRPRVRCTPLTSCSSVKALELAKEPGNSKEDQTKQTQRRVKPSQPRTLALHRLVAGVLTRARGLDDVTDALHARSQPVPPSWRKHDTYQHEHHLGRICDVFSNAGIDPAVWSAAEITRRLDLHAQGQGWTWPTTIHNPAAYLRWRISQLDWSTPHSSPPTSPGQKSVDESTTSSTDPATAESRRAHYAAMAEACGWTTPHPERSAVASP